MVKSFCEKTNIEINYVTNRRNVQLRIDEIFAENIIPANDMQCEQSREHITCEKGTAYKQIHAIRGCILM